MKLLLRIIATVMAFILGLQILPWPSAAVVLPAASPWVALGSALAARHVSWVSWLALPLLCLALVNGRWFCRRLCPAGLIFDGLGYGNRRNRLSYQRIPTVGRWLVIAGAGAAATGYAWFLWMDPLVLFNSFAGVWRTLPQTWGDVWPAVGFASLMLLAFLRPHLWCERLCPLGALQALLGAGGRRMIRQFQPPAPGTERGEQEVPARLAVTGKPRLGANAGRRIFLMALGGGALAWLTRAFLDRQDSALLRPPGALDESRFSGLCARCGNCIQACPERILVPDLGRSGLSGLLTPRLNFDQNYCDEWCHRCTQVCPSGAIRRMSLEEKRRLSLGYARIDRKRCIAWSQQQYCMVCSEFCPYLAIRSVEHQGIACPEVDLTACRGCGACQSQCPARPERAIAVWGRGQHTR